ncbi:hypothetical protein [Sphingobacterium mizutaii]|uniref:hypothetical protein n=1 Tax=Sphingobacterium mizutaii TaxID=1010 RepID=UPI001625FC40|nr:hypothetical protein [Sphingobacterium mizutaii]
MSKKLRQDKTTIDYTNVVLEKVNELYENHLLRDRALFILYLINRGTNQDKEKGYQLNVTNHQNIFSVNGEDWYKIFNPLVENNIIECTTKHVKGKVSKFFKINEPYFWVKNKGEIKKVYLGNEFSQMPRHIQQFHLDNQVVKSAKDTLWSKNYNYVPKSIMTEKDKETMNELKVEITMMREMMELMQISFKEKIESLENEIKELKAPISEETQTFAEPISEETHHGEFPINEDYKCYIQMKLRSAKVDAGYWDGAINYIMNNRNIDTVVLSEKIKMSNGATMQLMNKINRFWN